MIVLFENQNIRNKIFNLLRGKKFFVNLHYIPIYRHPFYKKFNFKYSDYPNCENYYKRALSIPVYYGLKIKEINQFVNEIKNFLTK